MNNQNELPEEESFSDDPYENLRMENDFLKMKMMVESGAVFGGKGDLPADLENQFLKNIIEFEKENGKAETQTIFDILGKPFFQEEENVDDKQLQFEYLRLQQLLDDYSIKIDFRRERDSRFKYNFITKEFFAHKPFIKPVKGMPTFFEYEEFHPDHELEITDLTNRFLNDFLTRELDSLNYYINEEIIQPDSSVLPKEQLMKRFVSMYDSIPEFENTSFSIENTDFELRETNAKVLGMGFSEGTINYDLVYRDGERKKINGPFKIYFSNNWDCWIIYFFYLAGFNLLPQEKQED